MKHEFRVVISSADDFSGSGDTLSAAAARTPDAPLESLAASARQAQAGAEAARQPMAGLLNVPDAALARLETGFGVDAQEKIIGGVERIGQVFAETWQRPPESSGGSTPADAAGGQPTAASRVGLFVLPKGYQPHQETHARTATDSLARVPGTADRPAGGADGFSVAPTAAASLGPALTGFGAPPPPRPAAAPGAPTGGQVVAGGTNMGKREAEGRGSEEAARPGDLPSADWSQGFRTLDERLARVEQTTREHTSQISNRS